MEPIDASNLNIGQWVGYKQQFRFSNLQFPDGSQLNPGGYQIQNLTRRINDGRENTIVEVSSGEQSGFYSALWFDVVDRNVSVLDWIREDPIKLRWHVGHALKNHSSESVSDAVFTGLGNLASKQLEFNQRYLELGKGYQEFYDRAISDIGTSLNVIPYFPVVEQEKESKIKAAETGAQETAEEAYALARLANYFSDKREEVGNSGALDWYLSKKPDELISEAIDHLILGIEIERGPKFQG